MVQAISEELTLRNGARVVIRPMEPADGPELAAFFRALPEEDRQFLREDVSKPEFLEGFNRKLDEFQAFAILAVHEGRIVGNGTLYRELHGWTRHVGEIRAAVAADFQRHGLGTALAHALVRYAISIGLDKLVAEVVENQIGARKAFERLGFRAEAVLKGHVRDTHGATRNLVIMSNDVSHIWETMEAMMADFSPSTGG